MTSRPARRALALVVSATALVGLVVITLPPSRAPAQDAGIAAAPPIAGIADKMGRRVLSELRQVHHAMPRVITSTHVTAADGAEDVTVLYEYADYDACVGAAPTKAAGREQCRDRLGVGASCTHRGIVRATIAATPRGRPAGTGGVLAITARREEPGSCQLHHVVRFERRDVDGDDRPELVVDLVTIEHPPEYRTGTPLDVFSRRVSVLRDDLTDQFSMQISGWGQQSYESPTESSAARWSFGTGAHPSLHVDSFGYEDAGGCRPDADGWFTPEDPDDEEECAGTVAASDHAYAAATDSYP